MSSSPSVHDMTNDLLLSVGFEVEQSDGIVGGNLRRRPATPAACATLRTEQRTQKRFRDFNQLLVTVLALVTLLLLIWAAIQLARGEQIDALLTGAAGIVTGGGAIFLERERRDARKAYKAALDAYIEAGC